MKCSEEQGKNKGKDLIKQSNSILNLKYSNKHVQMWTVWTVDSCPHSNSSQKRKLH